MSIFQKKRPLLLWFTVLMGYFLFVFSWVILNTLQGKVGQNGWISDFFDKQPSSTTIQTINYSITAMRAVGSIGAGYVIAKLGFKKAVIIAMSLLAFSFPAVFISYIKNEVGYYLFILGRMVMAIGGTVLIIYTQPIIARYFNKQEKGLLSRVNSLGFNIGTALPLILFSIKKIHDSMLDSWRIWSFIISSFTVILLGLWLWKGEEIEIKKVAEEYSKANVNLRPATWKDVSKDKNTWKLSCLFGAWITAVVAVILILPNYFAKVHNENFGVTLAAWEVKLPIILFLFALLPGIYLVGWINKTKINRNVYMTFILVLGISFIIAAYLSTAYIKSIIPSAIFMTLAGTCLWGIQGVILNFPHEVKTNSPQRVSIVISFAWGIGYLIYTIANIILAAVYDGLFHDGVATASWVVFGIFVGITLIAPTMALLLPRTQEKSFFSIFKRKN